MLPIIDRLWVDHLYVMDALKTGIGLRGYGQKDPRVEYEKEAYEIFEDLKNTIADEAIKAVFSVRIERKDDEDGSGGLPVPQDAPPPLPAPANGSSLPDLGFEPIPAGAMVPQAYQRPALDAAAAERILGPAPKGPSATAVRTNLETEPAKPIVNADKVGRNDPCPCGSGKKYKKCHGVAA
jgi:preprotein translocase subunit SecA